MSQAARDLSARFAHLLQPIKDLTKNWEIDVAAQLEEYLEEIEKITIVFDGESCTMNFAEAALLIQGSTCVYSKKVEYLYTLVYQTLDLISKRKQAQPSSANAQGTEHEVSMAQKQDEFLPLDMTEATNIHLDERLHKDNKMNTGVVHSSGALLLESSNHYMLSPKQRSKETPPPSTKDVYGADGCVPPELQHEDAHLFNGGDDDHGDCDNGDVCEGGGVEGGDTSPDQDTHSNQRRGSLGECLRQEEMEDDPWTLLDPHEKMATSENKPFRKGTTFKMLPCLVKGGSGKKKKRSNSTGTPAVSLSSFLLQTVYSCSSMFPKNRLKAPLSSEFEGLFWDEMQKRMMQKKRENLKLVQLRRENPLNLEKQSLKEEEADEDNIEDYQPLGDYSDNGGSHGAGEGMVLGLMATMEADFQGVFDNYARNVDNNPSEALTNLARLPSTFQGVEPMALDELSGNSQREHRQPSYEDLVQNYVESTLAGVHVYMQETELATRVEQWEEKIRPILAREEQYPVFDIHAYGMTVLNELQEYTQSQGTSILHFRELARTKTHIDISRMFAASLQLANDYSLEISCGSSSEQAVDTMKLTLLNPRPCTHISDSSLLSDST